MNQEISHERCSELLLDLVRGALGNGDEESVRSHLAGCEGCRAELAGLTALTAEVPEGLRDDERARLHDGVTRALGRARAADVVPLERPARVPRMARWLGAAAAVLVVAVGGAWALTQFGGAGSEDMGADRAGAGGEAAAPTQDIEGPRPRFVGNPSELQFALGKDEADVVAEGAAQTFGRLRLADSPRSLGRLARRSPLFAEFAQAYDPADAEELADPFLTELVEQAPPAAASQIEECGRIALDATESPLLPVFAARARYLGDRVLMMGFVTGDVSLDRYSVFVWPDGSCERPSASRGGPLPK